MASNIKKIDLFVTHCGFDFKLATFKGDLEALFENTLSTVKFNAYEWIGDFVLKYCISR